MRFINVSTLSVSQSNKYNNNDEKKNVLFKGKHTIVCCSTVIVYLYLFPSNQEKKK